MRDETSVVLILLMIVLAVFIWWLSPFAQAPLVVVPPTEVLPYTVLSGPTQVTNTGVFEENWASLCEENGTFLITRSVMESGAQFLYRIGVLDSDGNFERLSEIGDFQDVKPDWSSDCTQITFERLTGELTDVYLMELGSQAYPITAALPTYLHAYAPSFSPDGDQVVITVSDCTDCVPENMTAQTQFAIVTLGDVPSIRLIPRPVGDWGYMSNASFSDDGMSLIFNAGVSGLEQIAWVTDLNSVTPTYGVLTSDAYNHFMPSWLPGRNDAFVYSAQGNGHMSVNLFLNWRSYGLFSGVGECKDPDVRAHDGIYTVIATCEIAAGVSDFYQVDFSLP